MCNRPSPDPLAGLEQYRSLVFMVVGVESLQIDQGNAQDAHCNGPYMYNRPCIW